MSPSFNAHLSQIHDYALAAVVESMTCLVKHGAAEYAAHWNADTVEDYLHLLATDEAVAAQAAKMTSEPSMRLIVEDTLRGLIRIMAHVAEVQEAPRVHD